MPKKTNLLGNLVLPTCQILILLILFFTQDTFRTQPIPSSSYVTLTPESKILFGLSQTGSSALLEGWSSIEEWGVWSEKAIASMAFQVQARDLKMYTIRMSVNYLYVGYSDGFKYSIFINDKKYSDEIVTTMSTENFIQINLSSIATSDNFSTLIRFEFKTLSSPKSLGVSGDMRLLGIGIKSVELVSSPKM